MSAGAFYLPPRARTVDKSTEESLRAIEDYLQRRANVFAGKLVDGAVIGGTTLDNNGNPVQSAGLQSANWNPGVAGWRLPDDGNAEFQSGTFRGTVLGKSPTLRREQSGASFDVAAGIYVLGYPNVRFAVGTTGVLGYTNPAITIKRNGVYDVAVGVKGNMDLNGLFLAGIRSGDSVTAPGTGSGILWVGNSIFASGPFFISCSTLLRLFDGDKVWVIVQGTQQFDIHNEPATFFSVAYVSDP